MNEMYIWIIVGAIVILMAIIGYVAEKTDFGKKEIEKREKNAKAKEEKEQAKKQKEEEKRKKAEEKKHKKEKNKKIVDTTEEDLNVPLEQQLQNENPNEMSEPLSLNEDLNIPLEEVEPMEEDLNAPLEKVEPMEEDLNAPLEEVEPMEEDLNAPLEEVEPMEEDLNAPLGDTPIMSWEEPQHENMQDIKNINIELPDINSIQNNEVNKDIKEDDDIWKF